MTRHQYRITVGEFSKIVDSSGEWPEIFYCCCERNQAATLERRLIAENPSVVWLDGLRDEDGKLPDKSMLFGNRYISDRYISEWELMADTKERNGVLIGTVQP